MRPQRVLIVGSAGAGKTTIGKAIAAELDLPIVHLDRHFWGPNWTAAPPAEWRETCQILASKERWVMDGNYGSTLDIRLARADLVVFPDVNRWLCLWRALSRYYRHRTIQRDDIAPDCLEKVDAQFVRYILRFRYKHRQRLLGAIEQAQNVAIVRLRTRREIRDFLGHGVTRL